MAVAVVVEVAVAVLVVRVVARAVARAVAIDELLLSLHFSQTLYHSYCLLLVSQPHPLGRCVFLYLLPLLKASQPHPLPRCVFFSTYYLY